MKKILFLAIIAFHFSLFSSQLMAETMPASDSRVTYVGRTLVEGTDVSYDWTGVYFRLSFSGKSLTMRATDTKWAESPEWMAKDRKSVV